MTELVNGEIELPESATEARQALDVFGYDPDMDFRKLALEAQYHARGFRLVEKDQLIGVPHVIVGVTYREGYTSPDGKPGDYISVESVVADIETLNSPPVKQSLPGELTVFGNEPVVYNDGGTGIRRTLTQLFHDAGMIDVGKGKADENIFDRPYQKWVSGADRAVTGIVADPNGNKFRYLALRGLRKSEYESPYGPAKTFYLG